MIDCFYFFSSRVGSRLHGFNTISSTARLDRAAQLSNHAEHVHSTGDSGGWVSYLSCGRARRRLHMLRYPLRNCVLSTRCTLLLDVEAASVLELRCSLWIKPNKLKRMSKRRDIILTDHTIINFIKFINQIKIVICYIKIESNQHFFTKKNFFIRV
jgi:hypothetical protein